MACAIPSIAGYKVPMNADELRRNAAERIRAKHRRHGDSAAPVSVTITPGTAEMDIVLIEYPDGERCEFERLAPQERPTDDEPGE